VEKGELAPTEKLSKKLEKLFRIRLFQPVKKERLEKKKVETSLSLEDVAIIKK
jgi:ribosome-binding protein aMBF1 (putative translation factor)